LVEVVNTNSGVLHVTVYIAVGSIHHHIRVACVLYQSTFPTLSALIFGTKCPVTWEHLSPVHISKSREIYFQSFTIYRKILHKLLFRYNVVQSLVTFLSRWRSSLMRASVSQPGHTAVGKPSVSKPEELE